MSNRLQEIRARLDAATPGPWEEGGFDRPWSVTAGRFVLDERSSATRQADADLIAHAPADIAWLLDELERCREESERRLLLDEFEKGRRFPSPEALPARTRPGTSRTVWVEIDEAELDALRFAFRLAESHLEGLAEENGTDPSLLSELVNLRAVLARLPDAAAMRRRYP